MRKLDIKEIFKNKKVIVTGHTGFKGSWLSYWLLKNGAKVIGISNNIPTTPSHYKSLKLKGNIKEYFFNIEKIKRLEKLIKKIKPDFIFHLAAQSLVKRSFSDPINTWKSNTFGTLSLLDSLRKIKNNVVVILITSDKSYKNLELDRGYRENDLLGGDDPYSGSKGATEILINSYIKSFFNKKNSNVLISVARAGNVIGGGDWSPDRLIPDCMKSWSKGKKVLIRNPNSTRPWQHVIEVLYGYMLLASKLKKDKRIHGEVFNFGPSSQNKLRVIDIVKKMKLNWQKVNWKVIKGKKNFKESKLLQLNSKKSKNILNWSCILSSAQTIKYVTEWYKNFYTKKNFKIITLEQLDNYERLLKKKS